MCIAIELYRARIGLYRCSGHREILTNLFNHVLISYMLTFGLISWFLLLIYMSGDIELNPGPGTHIKGLLLNTRSVKSINRDRNKLVELQSLVSLNSIQLICLSETWLNSTIADSEILSPYCFNVYRKDRHGVGGGVLMAVHTSITSIHRSDLVPRHTGPCDILAVEVRIPKVPKCIFIVVYNPPGQHENTAVYLKNTLLQVRNAKFKNIHVLGDFNLPNLDMQTGIPLSPTFDAIYYYEIFQEFSLSHKINFPTHHLGNRLDLIVSSEPETITDVYPEEDVFSSDHFIINFTLTYPCKVKQSSRSVFNFKKANWQGLKEELRQSDLNGIINSNVHNISLACQLWTNKILEIVDKYIPKIRLKNRASPPWIDSEVLLLSKKKEHLRKRAHRTNSPEHWSSYRRLRNNLKTLLNVKYNQYIRDTFDDVSVNPKRFWGLVRSRCKNKSIPNEVCYNNITESSPKGKANLFNAFFSSNFLSGISDDVLPNITTFINPRLTNLHVDVVDVRLLLSTLNPNKACGPDNLPAIILKECAAEISPSLTYLYNLSLSTGIVPDLWKIANVSPVYKKGDKQSCANYRPISLLCITSKILERATLNKIYSHVSPFITDSQHGFLPGRSTVTQLTAVLHKINNFLDAGTQTDMIFLDFTKAFDSVSHVLLIHKLKTFGFSDVLLQWFSNYLSDRYQNVVLDGISSDPTCVTSGVPQGSILGPFLFLLYTNDIGKNISNETNIVLYADDAKLLRPIHSINDCLSLQLDLDTLQNWSNIWKLSFNSNKCKVLSFSRSAKVDFQYHIHNEPLSRVDEFNDLGVTVSYNLSWKTHVRNIVQNANRLLGLIKRTLTNHAPTKSKLLLYNSLIRPSLLYASTVWFPDKNDLQLIEGIQRRATKFILNDYYSDYKSRLINLGLVPLSFLREIADLCFFYKCFHNFYNFDILEICPLQNTPGCHTRSNDEYLRLKSLPFNTETASQFYTKRIVKLWNNLPAPIKSITCSTNRVIPFKKRLYAHYKFKLSTVYDPENTCSWVSHCRCARCRPI